MSEMSLSEYSKMVGIPEEELMGRSKSYTITTAREVYWYYLKTTNLSSCYNTAKIFNRVPSTILSGVKTVRNLIETNHPLIHPHKEFIETFSHQEKID